MGIPQGISLITGGGFHGKSTLLNAIVDGVYPHIPGDGREVIATDATASKIRAEDGRYIGSVDISPYINNLPYEKSTTKFCTEDASGSTSQASNIIEALEAGSSCLLLDEDTCATNFMMRDARMQLLVSADKEPITPFITRVRSLSARNVSTVLVVGGCGDYFDVADKVLMMDGFVAFDVTSRALEISRQFPSSLHPSTINRHYIFPVIPPRQVQCVFSSDLGKISARNKRLITLGEDGELDLSSVEQLSDPSQTRAIAECLRLFDSLVKTGSPSLPLSSRWTVPDLLNELERRFDAIGMDALDSGRYRGNLCRPRRHEVAAALNRLRMAIFC